MREKADRLMIVSNGSIDLYVYACDSVFQLNKIDVSFHTNISILYYPASPLSSLLDFQFFPNHNL